MPRSRRPAVLLAAALVGICGPLAGCGAAAGVQHAPTPSPTSRSAGEAAPGIPGVGSSAGPTGDDDAGAPVPTTAPAADAVPVAVAALTAYTDHTKTADAWYAALAPHLSAAARAAYAGTDPSTVSAHTLTGPPILQPAGSAYLAVVIQSTDAGSYTLLCSRADDGSWQVERITPPTR